MSAEHPAASVTLKLSLMGSKKPLGELTIPLEAGKGEGHIMVNPWNVYGLHIEAEVSRV